MRVDRARDAPYNQAVGALTGNANSDLNPSAVRLNVRARHGQPSYSADIVFLSSRPCQKHEKIFVFENSDMSSGHVAPSINSPKTANDICLKIKRTRIAS